MRAKFGIVCCLFLSASCQTREQVTLPLIEISSSPDGIVSLPDDVPSLFKEHFVSYTHVLAPNGKPIRILAQDGWTRDQIKHGRNVLEYILADHPGSAYGDDKSDIANALSDRKATMVFFNTEAALEEAMKGGLENGTDLSMQDLRANESPAVGDADYMDHVTRDAAYEEIWHLVHDYGIKPTRPEMIAEMRRANDAAAANGWRAWPDDEPHEHPNEYTGVLIDNYLDLWAVPPTKYEARPIESGEIPSGHSHFGRYFANSRAALKELDPSGYALLEKFFAPSLTYTPELPADFDGAFSMTFDPDAPYTHKTRYLVNARLTGTNDSNLTGNAYDNVLAGNSGDNLIDGRGGEDTVIFTGPTNDYEIERDGDTLKVRDRVEGRDGTDSLRNVEALTFSDQTISSPE